MIDLSIVSGTYNRLPWLQKMVRSVRQSFAGTWGIEWEIVLVDGGSGDGTLEWAAAQPEIRLIRHGELRGAVKAFNDGARAARGQYVVMANDDIEFVGDALPRAWAFMQAHPEAGMGCFYQDRNGRNWHVEGMPCALDGRQVHRPYGQVCIVPKALGDRVGWWGDYLHTYGGDNELSANVYQSGCKVMPLYLGEGPAPMELAGPEDGCKIHDNEPQDALRKINNIAGGKDPRAVRGHHPDSWAWGRKWRNQSTGTVGPLLGLPRKFQLPLSQKERFVYLPIYERGWEVQKRQKRGLREALARVGAVVEVDYVSAGEPFAAAREACRKIRPTVVLCQLHGPEPLGPNHIRALRDAAPNAWFVNWNGDYWPENLVSEKGIGLAKVFDLQLTVNRAVLEKYWRLGVNAQYWQIGWEPDGRGHEPRPEDRCDVTFLANGYSKARRKFVGRLRKLPWSLRLWGNGWPEGWAVGQCTYDFVTACRAYRGARFSIGDSQWPDSGFVSNRVFQALAAGGSALCHQWFRGMEDLGLEDGKTCVVWRDFEELKDKLAYYAKRETHRSAIAEAGERLALERHSFDRRVRELMAMKPREADDWR